MVSATSPTPGAFACNRELHEKLFESHTAIMLLLDPATGNIVDANPAASRYYGWSREELRQMKIQDINMLPEEKVMQGIEEIRTRKRDHFEFQHRLADGAIREVEVFSCWFEAHGKEYLHSIIQDVTERKRAEAARIESEERFRAFMDNSPAIAWAKDVHGRHLYHNSTYEKRFGVGSEDWKHKTDFELWPPDIAEQFRKNDQRVLEGKQPIETDEQTRNPDGSLGVWHCCKFPFQDASGNQYVGGFALDVTEHRRLEAQIKENLDQLQTIIDHVPTGIIVADKNGTLLVSNKATNAILGGQITGTAYGPQGGYTLHLPNGEPFPPDDLPLPRAIRGEHSKNVEILVCYKNGDKRTLLGAASPILNAAGEIAWVVAVVQDITERKEAEQALRESERRFRAIFEQAAIGVAEIDSASGTFLHINKKYCDITGYSQNEMLARNFASITHPDDLQTDVNNMQRLLRGEISTFTMEKRYIRKDGTVIWVNLIVSSLWEESESKMRRTHLAIIEDITERKEAEEKLLESSNLLREAQTIARLGSYILDIPTGMWSSTDVLDTIFGIDRQYERSVQAWATLIHPEDRPMITNYLKEEVLGKGKPFDKEYRIIRYNDQAERWIHGLGKLEFDARGRPLKMHGTIQDIAERKKLEEQLLKSQKLESIGTLAGGIAHDFNNLLQGIFGYISMAKFSIEKKEEALAMLSQAEEALQLSVNLTTQLLTFSKGGKPVKKPIDLYPVVERAIKFALSGSRTNYEITAPEDLRPVEADEGQLAQVIQNIVINANEAMSGHGTVCVSLDNIDSPVQEIFPLAEPDQQFVRIDIKDTGGGIPEQDLTRIFDPYFTTKEKGSGLGLATCYSIVKNHGGSLEVSSVLDAGSTFSIYLPALTDRINSEYAPGEKDDGKRECRILLMDDEEMVRNVSRGMIEALGYKVDTANDGAEAVQLYATARKAGTPYDLIILDLTVKGGMGGEEAVKKLRAMDPRVAAVVSSGYADSPVVADYRAYGFIASLNKPYQLVDLKNCIEKVSSSNAPPAQSLE